MVRLAAGPVADQLTRLGTGFGAGLLFVPFVILADSAAQWSRTGTLIERAIPGSNAVDRQFLGLSAWTVSYDLLLASGDDLARLIALTGTADTLTMLADTAAIDTRVSVVVGGRIYDRVTATLTGVDSPQYGRGFARCSASFSADGNP